MARAPVSAVVFDVGWVLFEWDLRHLFSKLIADPDELEWFVGNVVTPEWHYQVDEGRPLAETVPELVARFPEHGQRIAAYATRFNETLPRPVAGSHELVRALHRSGMPLYALTNFGAEFWAAFRPTQPIFDCFGDILVSGVEKLAKPNPAVFALAERRFGHDPGAMLFVDDNAANVDAARARGWQAHRFTSAGRLAEDLRERGLL